ncbi:MAG: translesion DNA synthesis-associated protein ImuA [Arenimonas sp.]
MSAVASLAALLHDRRLWRGQEAPARDHSHRSSGCAALDAALPGGGWPEAALVELLIAADGIGELSLLLPMLAALTRSGRPVLLVAPPYRVNAPAWQAAGLRLSQLHVLEASAKDALWAMEQALRSGCCGAVIGWHLQGTTADQELRRLQVAAEAGQSLGFAFRPLRARDNPSPAPLRLSLRGHAGGEGPELRLVKCRGALPPAHALPFHPHRRH